VHEQHVSMGAHRCAHACVCLLSGQACMCVCVRKGESRRSAVGRHLSSSGSRCCYAHLRTCACGHACLPACLQYLQGATSAMQGHSAAQLAKHQGVGQRHAQGGSMRGGVHAAGLLSAEVRSNQEFTVAEC